MITLERLITRFQEIFGKGDYPVIVRSPGRVNLIGEHTDYQEGFVLPGAINRYIYVVGRKKGKEIRIFSEKFQELVTLTLEEVESFRRKKSWVTYILGFFSLLRERIEDRGVEIYVDGDLPIGKGLSSSASLEIGVGSLIRELWELPLEDMELIKLAHQVENEFVGVPCGIMDQFVILKGKRNKLVFIDTRSLRFDYFPFPEEAGLLIIDSGVKRELTEGGYRERRLETETAMRVLKKFFPEIKTLRDLSARIEEWEDLLPPLLARRARHVVTENERVRKACEALNRGDLITLGKLLVSSHESLRKDYEVTCPEVDTLVDITLAQEGVYGARMTGAGFGGCIIALIKKGREEEIRRKVLSRYGRGEVFNLSASLVEGAEVWNKS